MTKLINNNKAKITSDLRQSLCSCVPTLLVDPEDYSILEKAEIFDYPLSTLAWVGDAVFELELRMALAKQSDAPAGALNQRAIAMVSARGQARLLERLLEDDDPASLSERERALLQRARNFHSKSISRGADIADYRSATALEALLGAHMLNGQSERVAEIIRIALEYAD